MRLIVQGRQLVKIAACLTTRSLSPLAVSVSRFSSKPPAWDYETEKKTFKLEAPPYYNFARDVVDKWAEKEKLGERGDNPAFWWVGQSGDDLKWNFQQVSYKSKLVANALVGPFQLEPGDLVIVVLPRVPQWWLINVACIRAGIILSPGTMLLRQSDIRYRLNAAGAKCVITNVEFAPVVDEVVGDCPSLETKVIVGENAQRPGWLNFEEHVNKSTDSFECINSRSSDPMTIFFTSGTTGAPKMAEHTHSSYGLGHYITARYFLDISPLDVLWNLSDTGWAKCAWSSLFAPWIAGACVFTQESAKFDPAETLQRLADYPVSHFCAPPTAVRFMVKENMKQYRLTSLRRCVSAGEPVLLLTRPVSVFCAPPTAVRFLQVNCDFHKLKHSTLRHSVCGGEPVDKSVAYYDNVWMDHQSMTREAVEACKSPKCLPLSSCMESRVQCYCLYMLGIGVNPEMLDEWMEGTGLKLYEGYGQSETTFLCGTYESIEQRPGSMGKAAPGIDLQIVDDHGTILPAGTEGDIGIRCKPDRPVGLFSRYIDDEERMKKSFVGDFYLTGDRAIMDEDGYVWFVGRSDDVILSSGYRIGPFEVESALLEHPAVLESAVVSSPDPTRGEVVKAFVTLTESYKTADQDKLLKELQEHSKKVTAPYKYPRKIEFVDTLPKTVSGKIRRVELRNKEWGRPNDSET